MSESVTSEIELCAVLWLAPEGGFVASNPEMGTTTQGETQEEALANLIEATTLFLEESPITRSERPLVTTFRVRSVA
jgi:predicted RNase H-like HicB family nuclease